jgi:hypothetical protein
MTVTLTKNRVTNSTGEIKTVVVGDNWVFQINSAELFIISKSEITKGCPRKSEQGSEISNFFHCFLMCLSHSGESHNERVNVPVNSVRATTSEEFGSRRLVRVTILPLLGFS